MIVDGHAAPIVGNFDGPVSVDGDFDFLAMAGKRFIDAIVDNFMRQVVRPRCIRIHARPASHWFKATQDLDVRRIISFAHLLVCPKRKQVLPAGILAQKKATRRNNWGALVEQENIRCN
jgi:hypothetical protein